MRVPAVIEALFWIVVVVAAFVVMTGCERTPEPRVSIKIAWCKTEAERQLFSKCVGLGSSGDEIDQFVVNEVEESCRRASCEERWVSCVAHEETYARNNASSLCHLKE